MDAFLVKLVMAIYKKPSGYRFATVRQGILWAVLGLFAGIYCLQPLMKATSREEKGFIIRMIENEETQKVTSEKR